MRGHIVTVNPSYATAGERAFWNCLAERLASIDLTIVELAARKIPGGKNRSTIIVPTRLKHIGKLVSDGPAPSPWLRTSDMALLLDWEKRRWPGETPNDKLATRGLLHLAAMVDTAIGSQKPLLVLSTNKIDHPCYLSKLAARHYGVPWKMVERSPNETIWIEDEGLFAESNIWGSSVTSHLEDPDYDASGEAALSRMRMNPAGFRSGEVARWNRDVSELHLDRPLVFLPMDNVLWTGWAQSNHPQNPIDNPFSPSPDDAIRRIQTSVTELGGTLLLRRHPSCRSLTQKDIGLDVTIIDDINLGSAFRLCDTVVGFNTKLLFVALAHCKPVVSLAPNPVNLSGSCHLLEGKSSLKDVLSEALERSESAQQDLGRFRRFCGWLESEYFLMGVSSASQKETPFDRLVSEIDTITGSASASGGCEEKVTMLTKMGRARSLPSRGKLQDDRRLPIFFDVWRLAQTAGSKVEKSGINKYIREMLAHFAKSDEIDLKYVLYPEPGIGQRHFEPGFFSRIGERSKWLRTHDEIIFPVSTHALPRGHSGIWLSPMNSLPPAPVTQGMPRVLVVHDIIHLKGSNYWENERRPPIETALNSIAVDRDFVICDSLATRRDLLKSCPLDEDRAYVVPLAYDAGLFDRPNPDLSADLLRSRELEPGRYVLALGQMEKRKNLPRLLEAFAAVEPGKGDAPFKLLVVLGDADSRLQAANAARQAGLREDQIAYVSDVTDEMLASLYSNAACYAYVSVEEGFGIPILEAMGSGCAVLTSNRSSMLEVAGDAAILCDPFDTDSIRHGLQTLLHNVELRAELIRTGRSRASLFSWKFVAKDTFGVLKDIVERKCAADRRQVLRRQFWDDLTETAGVT
jgi:glycosyltransferase involved in cell wall biosynthesis